MRIVAISLALFGQLSLSPYARPPVSLASHLPSSKRATAVGVLGFGEYLPRWLPPGFRAVPAPGLSAQYGPPGPRLLFRYEGKRGWVDVYEGPARCCLDSAAPHRVGRTPLSGHRLAYFSNQGKRFGGLYLFWDQGGTYIALNSPALTKQQLVRVADSFHQVRFLNVTGYVH